ncbi:hypothetical protein GCM10010435_18120 [Winogradskya consettensis]|uniref:Uncharacterized protein n=1 Tax=Winogradskya consettensis TaxID=113560 RepID=A0A919SW88_9ACTN|nr:hypothetical protein [Actinoplanes consettensis]GIM78542.1 hypothetical protein Aco04nite_60930 [Actinoplanes consettensis]
MIPEEDRGPAWLSDYGSIEADIQQMEDFAKGLKAEVADGYAPHANQVAEVMMQDLPDSLPLFTELGDFMAEHNKVKNVTLANTLNFGTGTGQAAAAASKISEEYRSSDAFAHATVKDVQVAFIKSETGSQLLDEEN